MFVPYLFGFNSLFLTILEIVVIIYRTIFLCALVKHCVALVLEGITGINRTYFLLVAQLQVSFKLCLIFFFLSPR